jgi:hypothetical protein
VDQTTIIVSPTGTLLRESFEDLAKVAKLPRGKLAVQGRCIVYAAIQGAYEQWQAFERHLALAKELQALHRDEAPRYLRPNSEEGMIRHWQDILENCPELNQEVSVIEEGREVVPDVGMLSPIDIYEPSVIEQRVSADTGLELRPSERHPDGHRTDPDDRQHDDFGSRVFEPRTVKEGRKDKAAEKPVPVLFSEMPLRLEPALTVEVNFGYQEQWLKTSIRGGGSMRKASMNSPRLLTEYAWPHQTILEFLTEIKNSDIIVTLLRA